MREQGKGGQDHAFRVIRSFGQNPNLVSSTDLQGIQTHLAAIKEILEPYRALRKVPEEREGIALTDALAVRAWDVFSELPSSLPIKDLFHWNQRTLEAQPWHDFFSELDKGQREAISRVLGIFKMTGLAIQPIATITSHDFDLREKLPNGTKRFRIGVTGERFFKIAFQGADPEELK